MTFRGDLQSRKLSGPSRGFRGTFLLQLEQMEVEVIQQPLGDAQLFTGNEHAGVRTAASACSERALLGTVSAHTGRAGTGLRFALGKPRFVKGQ